MKDVLLIILWFNALNDIKSQFITVGTTNVRQPIANKVLKASCDSGNKSGLIEHFFNVIFNEFHNTPPVCVCVQMCPDQPTYCYPNGCLKRSDNNKKTETPVRRIENVNSKPVFFLEEKNDFINDFVNKNYVDDNKVAFVPVPFKQSNVMPINMRPDPFKDRYKILFKYKKMPKVELKYNLGEQVKNTKSDATKKENMDISKTRWPRNKMYHHVNGHRMHSDSDAQAESRYYVSNDKDIANYPKYFKRELTKKTNYDNEELDQKVTHKVEKSEPDNTPFSLERLIDSLIENSFDNTSTPDIPEDGDINLKSKNVNDTSDSVTENKTVVIKNYTTEIVKQITSNTTTKVISMNFTNENVEKNKYTNTNNGIGGDNSTHDVRDMIASLSKRIEIQNNTSLEIMRQMGDDFDLESTTITSDKYVESSTDKDNFPTITTETTIVSIDLDLKTTKKSRQTFAKRLINSKNN